MNKITLDEYIKRSPGGSAVYNPRQVQYGQGMSYGQPTAPQTKLPANQNGQVPVYRPNQWSRPTMVKAPAAVQPETPAIDATKPTDGAGSNVMTWEDHMALEIEAARQKVLEVSNRKFKYNAYESPIYSIMRQEYLKEADLAAGRATAAAAQNAGGFGSSFAVMAGEEARRQVMEGFHDQEDELYAAAQSEFEAERASYFDKYLQLIQLNAMEQERLKTEAGASAGLTESASAAAQELQNTWGTDYSEKTQREYLASKGYSEADINAALESQRRLASGTVTDYKAGTITDAVTQAQSLDEAYRQGALTVEEYDAAKAQNSKVIMDNVNKGMIRIDDVDHAALGISDEEWSAMEDGEKKLSVFDRVGQLVKSGAVTQTDYYKLLYNDLKEEFESEEFKKSNTQLRDAIDSALIIQDLYDDGYMSEDMYTDLMYNQIVPHVSFMPAFETINNYDQEWRSARGEPLTASMFFKKIESGNYVAPGITTTQDGSVQYFTPEQKELLLLLVRGKRTKKQKDITNKAAKGATG